VYGRGVRKVLLGLSLTLTLLSTRRSEACSCAGVSTTVVPSPTQPAPLNTHVWVFNGPPDGTYRLQSSEQPVVLKSVRFAAHGERGEGYPREKLALVDELIPQHELAANTRYELVHEGSTEQRVISTFKTGQARDDAPPRWRGPTQLRLTETSYAPEGCSIGQPSATIGIEPVEGEASPAEQLLFAVYAQNPDAPDDKPVTLHRLRGAKLWLFGGTLCDPRDFDFPKPLVKTKLVLKALDLAGNASDEQRLDIVGPLTYWDSQLLARARKLDVAESPGSSTLPLAILLVVLGALVTIVVLRDQKS
jgi:hypothetical protein